VNPLDDKVFCAGKGKGSVRWRTWMVKEGISMKDPSTTESVLQHHLQCFDAGDLNGIISDYTENSVFFTLDGARRGTQ
jgi:hypothetical protein